MLSSIECDCTKALWKGAPSNAAFFVVCIGSDGLHRGSFYTRIPDVVDDLDDGHTYCYKDDGRCSPLVLTRVEVGIHQRPLNNHRPRCVDGVNTYRPHE
jgi:hypothetical protein